MTEADDFETVHASRPIEHGPRLCPSCGRYPNVWPSSITAGVSGATVNALCAEFEFHGFTFGEDGTVARLYEMLNLFAIKALPR